MDLTQLHGDVKARHGLAASLEQNENHVFVWIERENDPYVLALDKETGETVWKSKGLGATSWASPRLVPVANGDHLVLSGSGKMAGLDPASGDHLWTFDKIGGNSTPTPVPLGDSRCRTGLESPVRRGIGPAPRFGREISVDSGARREARLHRDSGHQLGHLWFSEGALRSDHVGNH